MLPEKRNNRDSDHYYRQIESLHVDFWYARISGAVAIGFPHHMTQSTNYQQYVFEDKDGVINRMEGLLGRQLKDLSSGRF